MDFISFLFDLIFYPIFLLCLVVGGVVGLGVSYILFGTPNAEFVAYGAVAGGVVGLVISLEKKPKG